jgi:hypothetical protein
MGADSVGVAGYSATIRADKKLFRNGEFLMGFTSSFRMGQLLRYRFKPPTIEVGQEIDAYMATAFIDGVRQCLKDGGFAQVVNGVERGGCFLVGFKGRLFQVDSDFQVGEPADGYDACGAGAEIVLGSLYSSRKETNCPKRLTLALSAAAHHSAAVRGPFLVMSI